MVGGLLRSLSRGCFGDGREEPRRQSEGCLGGGRGLIAEVVRGIKGLPRVVKWTAEEACEFFESESCIRKDVNQIHNYITRLGDWDVPLWGMKTNQDKIAKSTYPVIGMGCAGCAARVDKILNGVEGVVSAGVNFAAATAQIEYRTEECSPQKLQAAVQAGGYDLLIEDEEEATSHAEELRSEHYRKLKRQTIWAMSLSVPIMIVSMLFMGNTVVNYAVWIASTVVVFWFGRCFFVGAWTQLRHKSFNMDTLVANSTGIAYLFSFFNLFFPEFWLSKGIEPHLYFETASMLVSFILLGRTLEERAKRNTSTAISNLMGLRPKRVTILAGGKERLMPISRIKIGDTIVAHPGERIAVDGTILTGYSYVDESMLSGEPIPVYKKVYSKVYAGTTNRDGGFTYRADKVGEETVLAQIIRMVQEAQGSRAPIQNLVDKVAAVFVPTIISIAVVTFLAWYFLAPVDGFSHGLLTMMTVLIIACPCALGLATPTAIMVGIGKGAERGILIKDAESLQTARKVDMVVLDKTGTLTEGKPKVTAIELGEEHRKVVKALEQKSEHPLSKAIVEHLGDVESCEVEAFENVPGQGVKGVVNGKTYYIGSEKLLAEAKIEIAEALRHRADEWCNKAQTIVWFADDREALGVAALADVLKESSKKAVKQLHDLGIKVCLLTGDHEMAAREAAREAGIEQVVAGVQPQEKAQYIRKFQDEGHTVAMVGDGINDSAALAQADLSIAMGQGSDIAMDTAMVTILTSDLVKISETISLSRQTMRTLHQNLFWAFIYNTISVPIAAGVLYPVCGFLLHPMIGGAAMAFSSVSVVSNSLRLKRVKLGRED